MTTSVTYLAAEEHVNDLRREAQRRNQLREAQHNSGNVKIRRLAVIRPAGSHFALMRLPDQRRTSVATAAAASPIGGT